MNEQTYQPGDWVVYQKSKVSPHPGPRAHDIHPTRRGDDYSYVVDKYWIVDQVLENGEIILRTPGGKSHQLVVSDPDLRPATFLERWLRRDRFVEAEKKSTESKSSHPGMEQIRAS